MEGESQACDIIGKRMTVPLLSARSGKQALTTVALALVWCAVSLGAGEAATLPVDRAIMLALEQHTAVHQAELELQIAGLELDAVWARSTSPSIGLQVQLPELSMEGFSGEIEGALGASLSLPWIDASSISAELRLSWNATTGEWGIPGWGISCSHRLDLAGLDRGFE